MAAFEAFIVTLGIEPKDIPKKLGVFKNCKCGPGLTCADIMSCVFAQPELACSALAMDEATFEGALANI